MNTNVDILYLDLIKKGNTKFKALSPYPAYDKSSLSNMRRSEEGLKEHISAYIDESNGAIDRNSSSKRAISSHGLDKYPPGNRNRLKSRRVNNIQISNE